MPTRNSREYNRLYSRSRYARLRAKAEQALGGKCVRCPATTGLEFDHIDPSTKSYIITAILTHPRKLEAELAKCQLLCGPCHKQKSIADAGKRPARGQHGTLSGYRYCHCTRCRKAQADYCREWKRRRASQKRAKI